MKQWIYRKIIKGYGAADQNRSGVVLVTCLVFIGVLMLISAALAAVVMPEMRATRHHRQKRESFYQAEAVVQYTLMHINQGLREDTLNFGGDVVNMDFDLPEDINGDPVTELRSLSKEDYYQFTAVGRSGNAVSVVEVTLRRPSLLTAGLFGDSSLVLRPYYEVYSYDSRLNPNPDKTDSTGEAAIGTNEILSLGPGVYFDGLFIMGEGIDGTQAPPPPSGYAWERYDRLETDPLGVRGGALEDAFVYYSVAENNDNASASIENNEISVGNHDTFTLTGGRYYLNSLKMSPGSILKVETEPGNPVIIYMDGEIDVHPNSGINTAEGQSPSDFFIFSNSTSEIKILPNAGFQGMVYAPYADLQIQPSGSLFGILWGANLTIQPEGYMFIDTGLASRFPADFMVIEQWNQRL